MRFGTGKSFSVRFSESNHWIITPAISLQTLNCASINLTDLFIHRIALYPYKNFVDTTLGCVSRLLRRDEGVFCCWVWSMARTYSDLSDAELIHQLRAGKQQALRYLYDRYGGLVYTIAFQILSRSDEAEDLTQEVFLTFWKQDKFDPDRAALSTYLSVLVRSRALNKLRSRASQAKALERLQQWTTDDALEPTPLEKASLEEQQQAVRAAMVQLSENQRQVLEMNYSRGLSHSEIAQQINMPLGTVKSNARQGLMKLRQLLGDAISTGS
jgi:RNA polymerase sigma-70 factor, ECF subfamily